MKFLPEVQGYYVKLTPLSPSIWSICNYKDDQLLLPKQMLVSHRTAKTKPLVTRFIKDNGMSLATS